jgi:hypothetical protein
MAAVAAWNLYISTYSTFAITVDIQVDGSWVKVSLHMVEKWFYN